MRPNPRAASRSRCLCPCAVYWALRTNTRSGDRPPWSSLKRPAPHMLMNLRNPSHNAPATTTNAGVCLPAGKKRVFSPMRHGSQSRASRLATLEQGIGALRCTFDLLARGNCHRALPPCACTTLRSARCSLPSTRPYLHHQFVPLPVVPGTLDLLSVGHALVLVVFCGAMTVSFLVFTVSAREKLRSNLTTVIETLAVTLGIIIKSV